VDAASGVERWVSHVTTMPDSFVRVFNPVVANGVVYAAFTDDKPSAGPAAVVGGVAAFDAASGQLLWSQVLPHLGGGVSTETSSVVFTGTRVVSAALDGFLYGLDPRTGALVDTVSQTLFGFTAGNPNGGGWFCLGVQDTVLAVGVSNGVMIALDARNIKRKLWTATLNWGAVMDLTVDSERVYTGYAGGQFGVTDIATGKAVWLLSNYYFRPNLEAILWGPAADGSRIYVAADQDVYAFKWR
jgi:outer membrane protein assembly factor BamB